MTDTATRVHYPRRRRDRGVAADGEAAGGTAAAAQPRPVAVRQRFERSRLCRGLHYWDRTTFLLKCDWTDCLCWRPMWFSRHSVGVLVEHDARGSPRQQLGLALAQGPWPQILAVDLLVLAAERIEHGDAVGAGYFLTSFAATSVTALQVNSTKS
jgi:hypothetical protein